TFTSASCASCPVRSVITLLLSTPYYGTESSGFFVLWDDSENGGDGNSMIEAKLRRREQSPGEVRQDCVAVGGAAEEIGDVLALLGARQTRQHAEIKLVRKLVDILELGKTVSQIAGPGRQPAAHDGAVRQKQRLVQRHLEAQIARLAGLVAE